VFEAKKFLAVAVLCSVTALGSAVWAENQVLSEIRFEGATKIEKNAGVWIDGQYVGYLNELKGDKKILLLPGKHEIAVRQAGYREFSEEEVLEPGEVRLMKITLTKDFSILPFNANAEVKIAVNPGRAAVFIDEQFIGHAEELARGVLVTPDKHQIRIALPGYQTFATEVSLRPHQKCKIETDLVKGSIMQAGPLVSETR
jgi:hypothetical protein